MMGMGLLGTLKKQLSDVQFSLHVANIPSVLEALADDKIDLVRDLWLVQKPKRYPREHVEAFKQFIQR